MSVPASREQLKDWCLRQLGHPVIEINVDDDQVEDRIDEALQYFQQFHFDGVERWYLKHQITQENITNGYIPITNQNIIGITRIFPITSSNASINMFDLRYQLRLHELYDFTSTSYVNYVLTMQHIRTLDMLFSGEQPIRFNRHTDKLYLDWNWGMANVGEWLVIEGYIIADPETYNKVYNDRMLKRLATAYIKRQWGANMSKFAGMQLPGGITLNGVQLFTDAQNEISLLEQEIRNTYEEPPQFILG